MASMKSFHARAPKRTPQPPEAGAHARAPRAESGMPRADALLVTRGFAPSRTAAQRLIEAGRVQWRGSHGIEAVAKPAQPLPPAAEILIAAGTRLRRRTRRQRGAGRR